VLYEGAENEHPSPTLVQKSIKTIYSLTKNIYERVLQTQDNFQKIIIQSSQWKNIPMYLREKNSKFIVFGHQLTEMKTTRYAEVEDASMKIQQLLKANLLLFHNVPLVDPNSSKFTFPLNIIFQTKLLLTLMLNTSHI